MGFAGPRVVTELTGSAPAAHIHTSEFAFEHGLVDAVVEDDAQASTIGQVLRGLTPRAIQPTGAQPSGVVSSSHLTAWERLQLSRDPLRPKASAVLDALLTDDFELHGDRLGGDDPSVVARLGAVRSTGQRVLCIGQNSSGDGRIRSSGYWKAIRILRMAGRINLPVVTLIDTRGADPLPESEAAGIARSIAWTFVTMLDCSSPTLAVLIGEGGSGGALSMAPADRVIAWENAVFSVIAPEGAAAILYRDSARAPELAESLRITVGALVDLGMVDEVVPEPPGGSQSSPQAAAEELAGAIGRHISELAGQRSRSRLRRRHERWRRLTQSYIEQA